MFLNYNLYFVNPNNSSSTIIENFLRFIPVKISHSSKKHLSGYSPSGIYTVNYKEQRLIINFSEDVTIDELDEINLKIESFLNEYTAYKGYVFSKNYGDRFERNLKVMGGSLHG